jgi:hypothetical protein
MANVRFIHSADYDSFLLDFLSPRSFSGHHAEGRKHDTRKRTDTTERDTAATLQGNCPGKKKPLPIRELEFIGVHWPHRGTPKAFLLPATAIIHQVLHCLQFQARSFKRAGGTVNFAQSRGLPTMQTRRTCCCPAVGLSNSGDILIFASGSVGVLPDGVSSDEIPPGKAAPRGAGGAIFFLRVSWRQVMRLARDKKTGGRKRNNRE